MRFKILVVEDEKPLRDFFKQLFESRGFSVLLSEYGAPGQMIAVDSQPDILLCDVGLPDIDGRKLCQSLKNDNRTKSIPIILMSGVYKKEMEQVEGMEQGADDFILKPVSGPLLVAKVNSLLRQYNVTTEMEDQLCALGITLDVQARRVFQRKKEVLLTRKEFDLLTTFFRKSKRVLHFNYLLETIWGYDTADYNDPHTVETHISSLRRKFGLSFGKKIVSVPGLGYRFDN
jgi:DNA-binding response OmpR family regulator